MRLKGWFPVRDDLFRRFRADTGKFLEFLQEARFRSIRPPGAEAGSAADGISSAGTGA